MKCKEVGGTIIEEKRCLCVYVCEEGSKDVGITLLMSVISRYSYVSSHMDKYYYLNRYTKCIIIWIFHIVVFGTLCPLI